MSHDQAHRPPAIPTPELKGMPGRLDEIQAEQNFLRGDRNMLAGVERYLDANGLSDTERDYTHLPELSHAFNRATATVVNTRIDVLKHIPSDRIGTGATSAQVSASERAISARAKRHAEGREARLPDGTLLVTFPYERIDRYIDDFYRQHGASWQQNDAVRNHHRDAALQQSQSVLYPDGRSPSIDEQAYTPYDISLRSTAARYPQITMLVRLRSMYRDLRRAPEAEAVGVVLAACGRRLLDMGYRVGATAVEPFIYEINRQDIPE